jgi:sec-independent protein translocase protein TatA
MILLIVLLLIFGAKRLPEMGRSLGKGMREFKDSVTGVEEAVSTTTPTPTRVELPSAQSEPDTSSGESEARTEQETVR